MKNINDITQEELDLMAKHHRMYEYTPSELEELKTLIRNWVNENVSDCTSCGGGLREQKNQLNELYLAHKLRMQEIINERNKAKEIQSDEVITTKSNKTKKNGR